MKFKNQKKIEELKQSWQKVWSSKKPIAKSANYTINLYCETQACKDKHSLMKPKELPPDKELYKMLRTKFGVSKFTRIPLNVFKRTYIYFVCPNCGWEKFTKLSQIIEEKYIDIDICKDCNSDVCLWYDCPYGGYIKRQN